jgi:aryl-alcohol dehydrogenase-like predicted oxidoreductase
MGITIRIGLQKRGNMQYKKVGRTGLKVSAFGIGTMYFGNQIIEPDAINVIDTAFEKGINFIDTANAYSGGRSEEIVGKAIKNKRHAVVLATKVAHKQGSGPNDVGLSHEHIITAFENSLRRLNTDYVDMYYAHIPDYTTPIEETLRAFDILVKQGKVRYIACSNYRAWQLMKALWVSDHFDLPRFDCIQSPYNLLTRDIEYELLPCCANEGVGVTVYNPLAAGLLTGKYDFNKAPAPNNRFGREKTGDRERELYWSPVNFQAITHLKQITDAHGRNLAQFSLAWILNNPAISSIIIGPSSTKQLEEDILATDLKLTADETKACDQVWSELRPPRIFYGK